MVKVTANVLNIRKGKALKKVCSTFAQKPNRITNVELLYVSLAFAYILLAVRCFINTIIFISKNLPDNLV
jgi:hypothetical protein